MAPKNSIYKFTLPNLNRVHKPTKLNNAVATRLYDLLALGLPELLACKSVGISLQSFHKWMDLGNPDVTPNAKTPYTVFYSKMVEAMAIGDVEIFGAIKKHMTHDWRSAAWMLTRRHNELSESAISSKYQKPADNSLVANTLIALTQASTSDLIQKLLELPEAQKMLEQNKPIDVNYKEIPEESEED